MRSGASGAARLEATACCFSERALAAIRAEALSHQLLLFFLHLHLLWTCDAGSRGSASLPSTKSNSERAGRRSGVRSILNLPSVPVHIASRLRNIKDRK